MNSRSRPGPAVIKLPVITFPKESLSSERVNLRLRNEVVRELEKYGCFMAEFDTLLGCHKKLFGDRSKKIFDDLAETMEQKVSDLRPLCERFGIREGTTASNDILAYKRTAAELVSKIVVGLQLPEESTGYKFRMMKYKEEILGCSDQEFLAVLDLNKVNRLQMKTTTDAEWSNIDVRPSTFLIMAGKPLKERSEGKINPPELKMNERERKYSVGLFAYYKRGQRSRAAIGGESSTSSRHRGESSRSRAANNGRGKSSRLP